MTDSTSASLLLRLRNYEDTDAWTSFCDVYGPLVLRFCESRRMNSNDAADVAQEVLLRVAKGIRQFQYDRSRGRFRDWLFRIVKNEIIRWHHRRAGQTQASAISLEELEDTQDWNQQFHEHVLAVAMDRIRPRFSNETWQAFDQVWSKDLAANHVAAAMGRDIDFVYVSKSRVLKRLKLEIEKLAEDGDL